MSKIKKIKSYKTTDGEIFNHKRDAKMHQSIIDENKRYVVKLEMCQKFAGSIDVETDEGEGEAQEKAKNILKNLLPVIFCNEQNIKSIDGMYDIKVTSIKQKI